MSRYDTLRQLEREVGVMIRRVRRVLAHRAAAVHPDLAPASYLMLSWVVDHGAVRASELAEVFGIDKGAISRQVQQLTDLGLVDKVPDPDDGRATLVSASEEAVRRLEDVTASRRAWLDERLSEWSERDLTEFVNGLARYNRALGTD